MCVKTTDDIYCYVTEQNIGTVNDLINCVNTNDEAKALRFTKDDSQVPFSNPQRRKLIQL